LTTKFDPGSIFEENVRGTASVLPDLSGYTFGNLILSADSASGTRTYAAAGGGSGGNFNVVNIWTIKSGVTMNPSSLSGDVNEILFNGSMGFTNNANSPLSILGNVLINAPFSTSASMTVNFTGTSAQSFGGTNPVTFSGNVNLNNSAGLVLGNNTTIDGILTLTNGIITSSGTSLLYQNYPNPFNPSTIIKYDLPEAGFVTMKIYNILGKEIRTLVNDFRNAGKFNVTFDASNLPSGIYICTIKSNNFFSVRKMMLLK
jgi:hypothetical protein